MANIEIPGVDFAGIAREVVAVKLTEALATSPEWMLQRLREQDASAVAMISLTGNADPHVFDGIDPARLAAVPREFALASRKALLGGFAESRILDLHGDRMVRRDFAPGGRSTLQLKDIRLICELAESLGFVSPTLSNSKAQWEKFVGKKGFGDLDHSGLFRLYEGGEAVDS